MCLLSYLIPVRLIRWPLPAAIHVSASGVPLLPPPLAPVYDKEQDDKTTNEAIFFYMCPDTFHIYL